MKNKQKTSIQGRQAEQKALDYLLAQGWRLIARNYRMSGKSAAEIDLIMQDPQATWVFVEVRQRTSTHYGGAGASIDARKRQRIIRAAQDYVMHLPSMPAFRFDVVLLDKYTLQWIEGAFSADEN